MSSYEIADLHSHYPMHLTQPDVYDGPERTWLDRVKDAVADTTRDVVVRIARRLFSDPGPFTGPSITLERYHAGRVVIALSALYSPFDELFGKRRPLGPPVSDDFDTLLDQMRIVEDSLDHPEARARIVRTRLDLDAARVAGEVAIVHCVEGGFHLGPESPALAARVAELKARGVAYVTLAHLFYRQVATNVAALPFLPDETYHRWLHQPDAGLTDLGKKLVELLRANRILVDVTHMSARSFDDTIARLDALDGPVGPRTPIIASHGACRFEHPPGPDGKREPPLEYNLTDAQIQAIVARGGVIGTILCDHYARDGILAHPSRTLAESLDVVVRQIRRIEAFDPGLEHVAIGSDHDGFIKPTLAGLEDPSRFQHLAAHLETVFGPAATRRICFENVDRVLRYVFP